MGMLNLFAGWSFSTPTVGPLRCAVSETAAVVKHRVNLALVTYLVAGFALAYVFVGASEKVQDCVVAYGNRDADRARIVGDAAEKRDYWDNRVKDLVIAQGIPASDPEVREAYRHYRVRYQDLKVARKANPVPPFRCGD